MNYLNLLRLLQKLGDKLPEAIVIIQELVEDFQTLAALFSQGKARGAGMQAYIGDVELEIEKELAGRLSGVTLRAMRGTDENAVTAANLAGNLRDWFRTLKELGVLDALIAIITRMVA